MESCSPLGLLLTAWSLIVATVTLSLQFLMTGLMRRFPAASATYRRMAASALLLLTLHARNPTSQAQWLISRLLGKPTSHSSYQTVVLIMYSIPSIECPSLVCSHSVSLSLSLSLCADMGCGDGASSELVQGVLLSLQQLFSSLRTIRPPLAMLRQV